MCPLRQAYKEIPSRLLDPAIVVVRSRKPQIRHGTSRPRTREDPDANLPAGGVSGAGGWPGPAPAERRER
jgi:hypothetical protein